MQSKRPRAIAESCGDYGDDRRPESIALDEEYLRRSKATAIVRGEGELAMAAVLDALQENRSLDGIPGIFYIGEKGECIDRGEGPAVENLDELPFPAYDKS